MQNANSKQPVSQQQKPGRKLVNGRKAVLPADKGRFRIVGNVDGDFWTLVVEGDLYTLVTVRRAHEDEICLLSKR